MVASPSPLAPHIVKEQRGGDEGTSGERREQEFEGKCETKSVRSGHSVEPANGVEPEKIKSRRFR